MRQNHKQIPGIFEIPGIFIFFEWFGQNAITFKIQQGSLFVCDNEVAWLLENHFEGANGPQVEYSIETYRFGEDGSVHIRTYYRVPSHDNDNLGDIFKQYLPDNETGL